MAGNAKKSSAKKGNGVGAAKKSASAGSAGDRLYTEQVRQLVDLMVSNELTSLEIVNGDLKVSLGRGQIYSPVPMAAAPVAAHAPVAPAPAAHAPAAPAATAAPEAASGLLEVRSPMVGTFYAAPSPDSDPFTKVGARIMEDSVVCIIEAMKVMNEIKAEISGTIAEVVVKNGQPVEFGQVLFRVNPN